MKELEEAVVKAFRGMVASGKLEETIGALIERTVSEILSESLRSYSPFGKALAEQVKGELNVDLSRLGLGGYNTIVLEVVKHKLAQVIDTTWKPQLERSIEDLLRGAPAQVKVSAMLDQLRQDYEDDARSDEWDHATCIVGDDSYSSRWLYFDPQPRTGAYECSYRVLIGPGGRSPSIMVDGKHRQALFAGPSYGFGRLLFQLQTGMTEIVLDLPEGTHEAHYERCRC